MIANPNTRSPAGISMKRSMRLESCICQLSKHATQLVHSWLLYRCLCGGYDDQGPLIQAVGGALLHDAGGF